MYYIIEIIIAIILIIIFIKREKPQIKYLLYGFIFFYFTLILQIPFRLIQFHFSDYIKNTHIFSNIFLIIIISSIPIITKYLSLKKFLKTRVYKNAILFAIGWVSLESINIFSIWFLSFIFSSIDLNFNTNILLSNLNFLYFLFFYIFNLAITVLVIISVIKRNNLYLFHSILLTILTNISLIYLNGINKYIFIILCLIYSIYIIFKYKIIKK